MPCWTKRTTTVAIEAANLDLLATALEAEDYEIYRQGDVIYASKNRISIRYGYGQIRIEEGRRVSTARATKIVTDVKRAYATEAVKHATKRFGWRVQEQKQKGRFVATRKSFR